MAEYIEREATLSLLRSLGNRDYRREKGTIQDAIKMISFAEYTPAADVAPVVHGHWFFTEYEFFTCSECGGGYYNGAESTEQAKSYLNSGFVYNYCPNCGARMDGTEDNEK